MIVGAGTGLGFGVAVGAWLELGGVLRMEVNLGAEVGWVNGEGDGARVAVTGDLPLLSGVATSRAQPPSRRTHAAKTNRQLRGFCISGIITVAALPPRGYDSTRRWSGIGRKSVAD